MARQNVVWNQNSLPDINVYTPLTYVRHWRTKGAVANRPELLTMFTLVKLPRGKLDYPITIVELKGFTKEISEYLSDRELHELIDHIALHPEGGDIIPGTNGIRKLRWAGLGKGKSKALRVIYFYYDLNMPLYLLAVYSKGQVLRLSKREERLMAKLTQELVQEAMGRRKREDNDALGSSA